MILHVHYSTGELTWHSERRRRPAGRRGESDGGGVRGVGGVLACMRVRRNWAVFVCTTVPRYIAAAAVNTDNTSNNSSACMTLDVTRSSDLQLYSNCGSRTMSIHYQTALVPLSLSLLLSMRLSLCDAAVGACMCAKPEHSWSSSRRRWATATHSQNKIQLQLPTHSTPRLACVCSRTAQVHAPTPNRSPHAKHGPDPRLLYSIGFSSAAQVSY